MLFYGECFVASYKDIHNQDIKMWNFVLPTLYSLGLLPCSRLSYFLFFRSFSNGNRHATAPKARETLTQEDAHHFFNNNYDDVKKGNYIKA